MGSTAFSVPCNCTATANRDQELVVIRHWVLPPGNMSWANCTRARKCFHRTQSSPKAFDDNPHLRWETRRAMAPPMFRFLRLARVVALYLMVTLAIVSVPRNGDPGSVK